jgi:hypothetical protein
MSFPFGDDDAFYNPNADKTELLEEGVYPAHIIGLDVSRDITIRGKYIADIYNPQFRVADESPKSQGTDVRGLGVFRFKRPPEDNTRLVDRQGGGNRMYKKFLESLGVKMSEVKDESTGETLYKLPSVLLEDIYGKPVYIKVFHQKFISKRDDKEYTSAKATIEHGWGDGKQLLYADDVPF